MSKVNKKALSMLLEDERTALYIQLGMQKSSWEAGEIMKKSHYKYLEIKYRAEKYLRMFTEHLELYDEVIPKYVSGHKDVMEYLRRCMEERAKPNDLFREKGQKPEFSKEYFNNKISEQIRKWSRSEDPHDQAIFNLVKEFDRYNNFRILPKDVQEPSAFKRRIKKAYMKHVKVLSTIPKLSLLKILELSKTKKAPFYYLPIIMDGMIQIHRVKKNRTVTSILTQVAFYIFTTKEQAEEYIIPVFHYLQKDKKDCRDGLDFWETYREAIKRAFNYNEVQGITPSRKYLETAYYKLEFV